MTSQFMAPVVAGEEEELEQTLRPRLLDEFVGQEHVKEQLGISLSAAKARGEALDHVLLVGPPGLGKTSLALHHPRGARRRHPHASPGPALERKGDMAAILTSLEEHDVLFVDEIHRLNRAVEEILYPALEDFRLDIVVGQGPAARTLTLDLPPFTLVGATTRTGLLTTPLRDRFGMTYRLELLRAGRPRRDRPPLGADPRRRDRRRGGRRDRRARSRGTPRIANRILRRVRDVAEVRHAGRVTPAVAREALELLDVDEAGLERIDRELLRAIVENFDGGPVGLSTLAVALGEEPDTIEDVYEPYLLQLGFIQRTPRGRVITRLGRAHIGAPAEEPPASALSGASRACPQPLRRAKRPGSGDWLRRAIRAEEEVPLQKPPFSRGFAAAWRARPTVAETQPEGALVMHVRAATALAVTVLVAGTAASVAQSCGGPWRRTSTRHRLCARRCAPPFSPRTPGAPQRGRRRSAARADVLRVGGRLPRRRDVRRRRAAPPTRARSGAARRAIAGTSPTTPTAGSATRTSIRC